MEPQILVFKKVDNDLELVAEPADEAWEDGLMTAVVVLEAA